ncbi:MAG: cyclic nucleotide-binding domain-containing protein [Desulfobacterales bacterium]|nr:cyclic nucleotide-binding domain-containing protein [Desulfobacterales bacterium]
MKDFFELLIELNENDINWIFSEGREQQVIANTHIVDENQPLDSIFIVLEGLLGLRIASVGEAPMDALGPGEIIGEMSFLENQPAAATVYAMENSLLMALPRTKLDAKIKEDPGFAARLYRSFAIIISRRLRKNVDALTRMLHDKSKMSESVVNRWEEISRYIQTFKDMMQRADAEAINHSDEVPEELSREIEAGFRAFNVFLNQQIGSDSEDSASVKDALGLQVRREVLPYLLLTKSAERFYSKPRGYAGDYLTIEIIYQNQPEGTGRIGALLDRCFLNEPAAAAVRNRRGLLTGEILKCVRENEDRGPTRVTSLACGPAAEIFDAFGQLEDPSLLAPSLVDIDFQALAHVSDKAEKKKLKRYIHLHNSNLVYLALGRQTLDIKPQDLVYSIGLIDYFNDKFVIKLLNHVFGLLKPGGKVILGNFHPKNTSKAFMDHILDWKLIHRTEEDMNRLFSSSHFNRNCTNIVFEAEGVNMFAECRREG